MNSPVSTFQVPEKDVLRRALIDGAIQPFFQPQLNMISNEVVGVEVLARWLHPQNGLLAAGDFMTAIERCGLLDELLFSQLEQGLALQKTLHRHGKHLSFSYNVEVSQLSDPLIVLRLRSLFIKYGVPAAGITLEITERGTFEESTAYKETLAGLRMLGVQMSVDDFGAGHSSLQRLLLTSFHEVKVDSALVRTVIQNPRCQVVLKSIIDLGRSLGLTVVLEGIETEAQSQVLTNLGAIVGQGFLWARPMAAMQFEQWLLLRFLVKTTNPDNPTTTRQPPNYFVNLQ